MTDRRIVKIDLTVPEFLDRRLRLSKGDIVFSHRNCSHVPFEIIREHRDGTIAVRAVERCLGARDAELHTHYPREMFYLTIDTSRANDAPGYIPLHEELPGQKAKYTL